MVAIAEAMPKKHELFIISIFKISDLDISDIENMTNEQKEYV
jgi:hypothetical protein